MSSVTSVKNTLKLTGSELAYLQQFLNAHDRSGFYIAYNAFATSDDTLTPFLDTEFGKREASLQAKISSFSEEVGAAAFLANRLLQERHIVDGYDGIYKLSQAVAQSSMNRILSDISDNRDDGLITDKEDFITVKTQSAS